MRHREPWVVAFLVIVSLLVAACGAAAEGSATESEPARLEPIEGSDISRVILTEQAFKRLEMQPAAVDVDARNRLVIPYAAVYYGPTGETWTYTNPEPLTFVRHPISIVRFDGDLALLSDGPPPGTAVVTVGAAELYGVETGVGH